MDHNDHSLKPPKSCKKMIDVGRRRFLAGTGSAVAGVAVAGAISGHAKAEPAKALVEYPSQKLANIKDLKVNEPLDITYPDDDAPGVLLKLGQRVASGIGPDGDVVGFSTVCPHKGYPLAYDASDKVFNCPGHYSRFDAEKDGQQIWGQATQNLPQYDLRIDDEGNIYAEGVDELLYGRLSNVL